jgi:hypothetical protein
MHCNTAPVGAALVMAIKKNGTEVTTANTRPQIAAGATSGTGTTFSTTTCATGDVFSADIISVGSTTPGGQVTLVLYLRKTGASA